MISLKVKYYLFQLGDEEFVRAFFHNINYHLNKGTLEGKFPKILNDLSNRKLRLKDVPDARKELQVIQDRFKAISYKDVIWDIDNLNTKPPWGDEISESITSLSNYFVTSNGEDIFKVIFEAFDKAIEVKWDVLLWNTFQRPDMQQKADQS